MRKRSLLILGLVLAIAVASIGFCVVRFNWNLPNSVTVEADYSLKVYEEDQITECLAIDWGIIGYGQELSHTIYVQNVGTTKVWVAWNCSGFPSGLTLSAHYGSGLNPLPENDYSIIGLDALAMERIKFFLTHVDAEAGSFTFNIDIWSADTSSG